MSSSENLTALVRAAAAACAIPLREEWIPDVAIHLQRLLDAAALLDATDMTSEELAPRFEP